MATRAAREAGEMVSSWAAPVTYLKEGGDKMKAERILTGTRGISDPEGGGERAEVTVALVGSC